MSGLVDRGDVWRGHNGDVDVVESRNHNILWNTEAFQGASPEGGGCHDVGCTEYGIRRGGCFEQCGNGGNSGTEIPVRHGDDVEGVYGNSCLFQCFAVSLQTQFGIGVACRVGVDQGYLFPACVQNVAQHLTCGFQIINGNIRNVIHFIKFTALYKRGSQF